MVERVTKASNKRSRTQVWLIALVFVLPIAAALLWRPTGYVNYGELVEPAKFIKDERLAKLDGTAFRFSQLHSKWTLLYIGGKECADACQRNLYKIQQVRLAQTKNAKRVQSVYLIPAADRPQGARILVDQYPSVIAVTAEEGVFKRLLDQFEAGDRASAAIRNRIYVIDPLGNLMMRYPPDADPSGMRKDLNRLLKVSQVG